MEASPTPSPRTTRPMMSMVKFLALNSRADPRVKKMEERMMVGFLPNVLEIAPPRPAPRAAAATAIPTIHSSCPGDKWKSCWKGTSFNFS